ncbi:MAG: tRNA 2-thiouridine(34) synthase MnmA [Planctomycetes bacterium]|nr:tRNA 2-thiouridine(34) synthase MnmA [Planctomycetota bacterium]
MKKVVVAMSGGVDSSVAAYFLKKEGYDVSGLFMSLGTCLERLAPKRKACCSIFDAKDAQAVADKIGIDFSVLDFKADFEKLIEYFCSEYDKGRTPNPCVRCNQLLKFGRLWDYAAKLGAEYIATGHYARIERQIPNPNSQTPNSKLRTILKKGIDQTKDQSYMLSLLTQEQLSRTILPLGSYTKTEIRKIASDIPLHVKDKLDSQEICFVPSDLPTGKAGGLEKFLKSRIPEKIKPGVITDLSGKVIGRHPGYQFFTIGQRHLKIALGRPVYVVKITSQTNTIVVGDKKDVFNNAFIAEGVNWISREGLAKGEGLQADVKIRYLHRACPAKITSNNEKLTTNNELRIEFSEPQASITPGQATVFYDGDTVLGGGWIKEVIG